MLVFALACILVATPAPALASAKETADVQIAWLGGGRAGGAQWIASRPAYRERDRVVSGAIWGFDADGDRLWRVPGVRMGKRIGQRLARIGDVDGDGCPDFVASSYGGPWQDGLEVPEFWALNVRPLPRVEHLGSVRCFSGKDGRKLWVVWSRQVGDRFGEVATAAGDLDGDGAADVAVVRSMAGDHGAREGRVEVLSGVDGRLLHVFDKPWSERASFRFGCAIAGGSDLDGDGWPELAVSSPGASVVAGATGRVDLFGARDGGLLGTVAPDPRGLDPYPGTCGEALGFLPDLDGDGIDELFVSFVDRRVDVLDGAARRWMLHLASPMFSGNDFYSGFGSSVAVVGDADGDERLDLLVATREEWVETERERYDMVLFSGCDGSRIRTLPSVGRHNAVAGAREAPWDVLIALPTQERVFLVREATWRDWRGATRLEALPAIELEWD